MKKSHNFPPVKPVGHKPHPTQRIFCGLFATSLLNMNTEHKGSICFGGKLPELKNNKDQIIQTVGKVGIQGDRESAMNNKET